MGLFAKHKDIDFGVGDIVKVYSKVKEGDKVRKQMFEGTVIRIKGADENKTFTVRRIGAAQVGIERIFPLSSPTLDEIKLVKRGVEGVSRSKLYYIRDKSKKEIDTIYSRAKKRKHN